MRHIPVFVIFVFCIAFCGIAFCATELTYIDLINTLIDLERPAVLPEKGEVTRQWSSYDRRSKYNEKTGKYINWEANGDGYGAVNWIRKENGKFVLGEMTGPGCIWRIWTATAKKGHICIYLDGAAEPAVDLPCEDYFNCTQEPFNRPQLVHTVANGKNSYIPIPFQKSCKIVADKDYGQYYQFTYTLFSKDTKVPTFKRQLSKEESDALDNVDKKLANCGPDFNPTAQKEVTDKINVTIGPGQKKTFAKISGPRAITSIIIKNVFPEDTGQQRQILRELVLQITWDGQEKPGVWCPLGDFFGTAPGLNKHKSITVGVTDDCLYSNWFMPFGKEAKLELINEGKTEIKIPVEIKHIPLSKPVEQYGRFHAKWHRDAFLPTEPERRIDWTILKTQGAGRFCGVELEVWNPRGGWWGEGDEKFFVDGEKFPSTFGTGSEDYFGYAWSSDQLFNHPFHNQTINEGNKGHISDNRWQIADSVPFQKSFEGCIEKYFSNSRPTLYSCVAYWYLSPDGQDPYEPVVGAENRLGWYGGMDYPLDIAGIYVLEKPVGQIEAQGMGSFHADKWTDDDQLWWIGEPNGKLRIGINAEKAGNYKILTRLTKAVDYGIIQWYLDGKKISEPMDLYYASGVIATKEINLGKYHLGAGQHEIDVEIVGSNPAAIKRYMVGIDYIKIKPQ
ncbi:MAG: glycoside hydrolase family 172 protein [Sedimentisphaerales bacterium]